MLHFKTQTYKTVTNMKYLYKYYKLLIPACVLILFSGYYSMINHLNIAISRTYKLALYL